MTTYTDRYLRDLSKLCLKRDAVCYGAHTGQENKQRRRYTGFTLTFDPQGQPALIAQGQCANGHTITNHIAI